MQERKLAENEFVHDECNTRCSIHRGFNVKLRFWKVISLMVPWQSLWFLKGSSRSLASSASVVLLSL